jgi:hypothetical protein
MRQLIRKLGRRKPSSISLSLLFSLGQNRRQIRTTSPKQPTKEELQKPCVASKPQSIDAGTPACQSTNSALETPLSCCQTNAVPANEATREAYLYSQASVPDVWNCSRIWITSTQSMLLKPLSPIVRLRGMVSSRVRSICVGDRLLLRMMILGGVLC